MLMKYRIKHFKDSIYTVEVRNPNDNKWYATPTVYDTLEEAKEGLNLYVQKLKEPSIVEEGYVEV